MYEHPPEIPDSRAPLAFETATIRAENVDEYFFRLISKQVDSLTVDGVELIYVQSVEKLGSKGVTRVVCEAADRSIHEFIYDAGSSSTVLHQTSGRHPRAE